MLEINGDTPSYCCLEARWCCPAALISFGDWRLHDVYIQALSLPGEAHDKLVRPKSNCRCTERM